jgi:heat shock protein HspQ
MGVFEFKDGIFDKPSKVFSMSNMRITLAQDDKPLYNKPFVFILQEQDQAELVYSVGNRVYF